MKRLAAGLLAATLLLPAPAGAHRKKRRAPTYQRHHQDIMDDLDHCESTHGAGSANRFAFVLSTWRRMPERAGRPETHTYEEQRDSARWLVENVGWGQFPGCARRLGVR